MSMYRSIQNDIVELGGVPVKGSDTHGSRNGDFYPQAYWVQNGNATQIAPTANESSVLRLSTTPAVPKMGVRARIADWPPKREAVKDVPVTSPSRETEISTAGRDFLFPRGYENGQYLQNNSSSSGFRIYHKMSRKRSKDVEFQDSWPRSPGKLFIPLRNRSNSEITLSECDFEEISEPRSTKYLGGMPLFREYGSTSSIDVQGISEQSFFEMLSEFRNEKPDQLCVAPEKHNNFLRVDSNIASNLHLAGTTKIDLRNGQSQKEDSQALQKEKEKSRKKTLKGEVADSSIFRKLRSSKSENDTAKSFVDQEDSKPQENTKPWICQKSIAHYDVQSMLFDLNEVAANRVYVAQRRNTTTGASAASAVSLAVSRAFGLGGMDPTFTSTEDLIYKENLEHDLGDNNSNELLLSCPHFRNELGGMCERNVSFSRAATGSPGGSEEGSPEATLNMYCTNASISVLEVPKELQRSQSSLKHYSVEHVDLGARYFQDYFYGKEHSNYFGVDEKLGPVAVSIRREKLEDIKDYGSQYQYRIIFRTSELVTLRGLVLEDAVPSTAKHGTVRGLPLKDVLEYVLPELNISCLRLAAGTPKVTEQLLKLDEQGLCRKHKVGILYCKAGQSSEEEMYNNEDASPSFEEFLSFIGKKVCLKGFSSYAAQLDTKTDSTGTHSLYTTYQDYEIMFHVSTMLPYTPNNRQQLLRKRHIGNDIVTIIFQEPGTLPFTPQNIRSHFQHVFIIVRAIDPCTDNVCYSVAVTRSKDVPPFGPPVPSGITFRKSDVFRDFLLAKMINAENAAHKSDKFHTMATRTRQEYLKDLAENSVTNTPIDSTFKFNLISLTSKKKEKMKPRLGAELYSVGAIAWHIYAQDFAQAVEIECVLGISNEFIVLLEQSSKEVVFNCFCEDVIGWTPDIFTIKIFYGKGDHILIRVRDSNSEDIKVIVQRLKIVTTGCETVDMTLRRNGLGQLGFHVKFDGTVTEVEDYGFAWQAGLRQGSRLVEICKVAVVTLTHDQMIDLLRTSVTVKVVIVPPHENGDPRSGWLEMFESQSMDHKELESLPAGYRPPYRSNTAWQWSMPAAQKWTVPTHAQSLTRPPKQTIIVPYRESQSLHSKRPVSFPETPYTATSGGIERIQPYRQPSSSFSSPGSGPAGYNRFKAFPDRYGSPARPLLPFEQQYSHELMSSGDSSSGGFASQESTMERHKPEPQWHVPAQSRFSSMSGNGVSKRPGRQDHENKDSPNRHSRGETQYSSHSSSNTLSSNASSSHSDERWFDTPELTENEQAPVSKGGSSDSGIDSSLYASSPNCMVHKPSRSREKASYPGPHESSGWPVDKALYQSEKRKEAASIINKAYRPKMHTPTTGSSSGGDMYKQGSNLSLRPAYLPQAYKTPVSDKPTRMSQSSSFQLSSSVPKSFYSKQHVRNKHPTGWKKPEDTPARPVTFTDPKKQVDMTTKNVFGQPRLRASLRDLRSPRKNYKSTIEDDLKKLIIMDNSTPEHGSNSKSPQKTLQRTLSDESLCSGRRDASYAIENCFEQSLSSDVLFTSTYPSSTLPVRRQQQGTGSMPEKKSSISASELSLTEIRDKPSRRIDPGMMPLPDTVEWSSLVSAAKAYEVQRAVSLFSLNDPVLSPDGRPVQSPVHAHLSLERQPTPHTTPTISEEPPADLTGKVYQLEVMLKQLHTDLQKEKKDKVALQAEVASLRQNNQRLQEESVSANEQLRKFAEIFTSTAEKKES
ncbi:signal-induced proliferation-associated 1-like protein 3 isoform X1 [Microcaecilia unicolor]|uniref:Signal-induced proliferation-associated 1-like protein 3 isoform X1 n=1 Tax=Microcaecilia unicolor TaxID=1415580 RepID=A0A6P7ZBX1_9AMPH|nr:signal-induced proliferation-associated 1-like protein 3 isoform X1 [Microcaecilia unicolor]XP_030073180.1 signal-induced proliferation-associated 1-like protein 3 isoform X1 [Microcaecilia unicolor]